MENNETQQMIDQKLKEASEQIKSIGNTILSVLQKANDLDLAYSQLTKLRSELNNIKSIGESDASTSPIFLGETEPSSTSQMFDAPEVDSKILETQVANLKKLLSDRENELAKVNNDLVYSQQNLSIRNEKIASLEKEVRNLEIQNLDDVSSLKDAIKTSEDVIDDLKRQILAKDEEIKEITTRNDNFMAECDEKLVKYESLFRFCGDEVKEYASLCMQAMNIVISIVTELDKLIRNLYEGSDDANYFYVRRRIKFLDAVDNLRGMYELIAPTEMLAKMGCVRTNSDLDKAIGFNHGKMLDAYKYYMYSHLMKDLIGPTLILLKEMLNIDRYLDLDINMIDISKIERYNNELLGLISPLGYRLVDVKLFEPMPPSDEIDCVEASDVDLAGLYPGDVYEITKLAVLVGPAKIKTEVKIKR